MEIQIKNGILIQDEFLLSYSNLLKRRMPAKLCLEFNTAQDEIVSHVGVVKRTRKDIATQYGVKDEEGNLKADEVGNVLFEDAETDLKCRKEIQEVLNESLTVEVGSPVTIYEDEEMTPTELRLLGQLVLIKERPKENEQKENEQKKNES